MYDGHVLIESYNDLLERRAKQPNERLSDLANEIYAKWLKSSMLIVVRLLETE